MYALKRSEVEKRGEYGYALKDFRGPDDRLSYRDWGDCIAHSYYCSWQYLTNDNESVESQRLHMNIKTKFEPYTQVINLIFCECWL